ncbi:DUF2550 domain-containing protein [Arsenicicoccus piscis]|uniref:DUF2550 family protein n=1 Tax=Arsenicicoccus piscis TaxID=673954 RepID=UPI001F4CE0DF|nr:DUF2550 family protein [Arsenicicoccus piscis]MCH8629168.1 DUF2550 domain-containing protein [Arsenicicoccus piscis]
MAFGLLLVEWLVCALLLLVVLLLALTFWRRRYIAAGAAMIVCAERVPGRRWHVRLARYDVDSVLLYPLSALSVRPSCEIPRTAAVTTLGPPVAGDMPALVDDPIVLRSQLGAEVVEIALPRPAYTSMRSWFEAAPPGIGHSA